MSRRSRASIPVDNVIEFLNANCITKSLARIKMERFSIELKLEMADEPEATHLCGYRLLQTLCLLIKQEHHSPHEIKELLKTYTGRKHYHHLKFWEISSFVYQHLKCGVAQVIHNGKTNCFFNITPLLLIGEHYELYLDQHKNYSFQANNSNYEEAELYGFNQINSEAESDQQQGNDAFGDNAFECPQAPKAVASDAPRAYKSRRGSTIVMASENWNRYTDEAKKDYYTKLSKLDERYAKKLGGVDQISDNDLANQYLDHLYGKKQPEVKFEEVRTRPPADALHSSQPLPEKGLSKSAMHKSTRSVPIAPPRIMPARQVHESTKSMPIASFRGLRTTPARQVHKPTRSVPIAPTRAQPKERDKLLETHTQLRFKVQEFSKQANKIYQDAETAIGSEQSKSRSDIVMHIRSIKCLDHHCVWATEAHVKKQLNTLTGLLQFLDTFTKKALMHEWTTDNPFYNSLSKHGKAYFILYANYNLLLRKRWITVQRTQMQRKSNENTNVCIPGFTFTDVTPFTVTIPRICGVIPSKSNASH